MMYNGYPYGIFDLNYLTTQHMRQEAQRQWEQNKNLSDLTRPFPIFWMPTQRFIPIISRPHSIPVLLLFSITWRNITEANKHDHPRNRIQALEPVQRTA